MSYRCKGCREYQRGQPYRKVGLSSVCSAECLTGVGVTGRSGTQPRKPNVPDEVRALVHVRDRGRCRYCGVTANLHAHHIHYRSEGVDHSEDNLITLCVEHHGLVHSNKARWQPVCLAYVAEAKAGRRRYLLELDRQLSGEGPART